MRKLALDAIKQDASNLANALPEEVADEVADEAEMEDEALG